jgi:hypothetical protein
MADARLLAQAAGCYQQAGWLPDARRCWELAGEPGRAAAVAEELGDTRGAAPQWERAGRLADAARCYLAVGDHDGAVRCLAASGEWLEAAWIAAHTLHDRRRARDLLASAPPTVDALARRVVLARIDNDADVVRVVLAAHSRGDDQAGPTGVSVWVIERVVLVAEAAERPDRVFELLSAVGGADRWAEWASRHGMRSPAIDAMDSVLGGGG